MVGVNTTTTAAAVNTSRALGRLVDADLVEFSRNRGHARHGDDRRVGDALDRRIDRYSMFLFLKEKFFR